MALNLKDTLRRWQNDETITGEERELLITAGLLKQQGPYGLTEAGRTLLIQNPEKPEVVTTGQIQPIPPAMSIDEFISKGGVSQKLTPKDTQVGGDHYKKLGEYQPWQVLAEWMTPEELRGFMKGTVIAYLARERDKGGDADIAKARHTIELWEQLRKDKP